MRRNDYEKIIDYCQIDIFAVMTAIGIKIGIGFLIGIFSLVRTGALLPLALVVAYGFLSIRFDNTSILDFIRYAAAYFFTRQQYFEWRDPT